MSVGLNPFPGLRPFEAEEDYLFFGRERQTDELLHKLRTTRFLSILGRSGSGKSSLVRSGLIPALWGGGMTAAGSQWRVVIMRPGEDPMASLAKALTECSGLFDEVIEENLTGISCFGFALRYSDPATDAISCSLPHDRLTPAREDEIISAMEATRLAIEQMAPSVPAALS